MGFNFPDAPSIGQLHPASPQVGIPQYQWNGSEWVTPQYNPLTYVLKAGDTMTGALNVVTPPTLAAHAASKAYVDAYAAPFDAMAYSGMQINGSMEVSQERGGAAFSQTAGGTNYTVDGWRVQNFGVQRVVVAQQGMQFTGIANSIIINNTNTVSSPGANDVSTFDTLIEYARTARLAWGTVDARPITIAFWVYSSKAGNLPVFVRTLDSAGDISGSYVTTVAITVGNQYKTVTIPGNTTAAPPDALNKAHLNIGFTLLAGTTAQGTANTWTAANKQSVAGSINMFNPASQAITFSGVVVLPGSYAPTAAQSPLIMRSYDQELVTCMRYFEMLRSSVVGANTTPGYNSHISWFFKVNKRVSPTLTLAAGSVATPYAINIDQLNAYAANASVVIAFNSIVDARL